MYTYYYKTTIFSPLPTKRHMSHSLECGVCLLFLSPSHLKSWLGNGNNSGNRERNQDRVLRQLWRAIAISACFPSFRSINLSFLPHIFCCSLHPIPESFPAFPLPFRLCLPSTGGISKINPFLWHFVCLLNRVWINLLLSSHHLRRNIFPNTLVLFLSKKCFLFVYFLFNFLRYA